MNNTCYLVVHLRACAGLEPHHVLAFVWVFPMYILYVASVRDAR